jgi:hypothetical protein
MQVERTVYKMILMRKCQFRVSRFKNISEEDATRSPTSYLYERLKNYRAIFGGTLLFRKAVKNCIIEILFYPRADGTKRRARVLIPPGYLHSGKRKH